jgi:4-diphosphocytidyl-2-C-methyl-D-erythritol kinase
VSRTQRELAYAKINVLLRILAREASGYHTIETLFQRIALHDDVAVTVDVPEHTLAIEGPALPASGIGLATHNLAWRAAQAYVTESGWNTGWRIAIEKRIPVGGGLGGGSADAAAVLRALEHLSPVPLGRARILELAAGLGADVPFFVSGFSRALAWGRGDCVLELTPLTPLPVTLVVFSDGVSTADAYAAFAERRSATAHAASALPAPSTWPRVYDAAAMASWSSVLALGENDFEAVVPACVRDTLPHLRAIAERERARGNRCIALLSGSGATCALLHMAPLGAPLPMEWTTIATTTQ